MEIAILIILIIILIAAVLIFIFQLLNNKNQIKIMATLDQVLEKVTEGTTLDASLIELMKGIKGQLTDALSGVNLPPAVQTKVDAIFDAVTNQNTKVTEALVENTPEGEGTEPE